MRYKLIILFLFLSSIANAQLQRPPLNGSVNIATNTSTSRTQLTNIPVSACTLQANAANVGAIYVGGSTVTNASGANIGIKLIAGDSISNITLANLNHIYVATDTANDDVNYFCN